MISILMASHNANKVYFQECMHSILNQSYRDFEIVIVDDFSDISVEQLLLELNIIDERIVVIRCDMNIGLPRALNLGMKYCKGEYIARMDDDDIMCKDRLEKQYKYMSDNAHLTACFSWYERIDSKGRVVKVETFPIKGFSVKKTLLSKGNVFCHSSLFIKKEGFREINGYDENLRYAQDCDLYIRLLEKYEIGIVNSILLQFRINNYRTNYYRDCLSLTYSYFAAFRYFAKPGKLNFFEYIWFAKRTVRFFVGCIKVIVSNKSE